MSDDLARKLYDVAHSAAPVFWPPWERADPATQEVWESLAAVARAELDAVPAAQRDLALDYLARLVRQLDGTGGYMAPEHQATLRGARALLVEAGRSVP